MIGRPKKELMYYSQYLDPKTMRIVTPDDLQLRAEKESKFYKAIRGVDEKAIEKKVPLVVKFVANEIQLLGKQFFTHTVEKSAVVDEKNSKHNLKLNCYRGVD